MYAKYAYLSSWTIDEVCSDVGNIITGETNPANLSASCDTANTTILTGFSTSPWLEWDDEITALDAYIMRLELDDDSGVYKYVGLRHNNSNDLTLTIMEGWDQGTNVATNETATDYTYDSCVLDSGNAAYVHIYASQYAIVLLNELSSGLIGTNTSDDTYGSIGVFECTRDHPSLAVGDQPNWFMANTSLFYGSDNPHRAEFTSGRDETDTVLTPFSANICYLNRARLQTRVNPYNETLGQSLALTGIGNDVGYNMTPILVGGEPHDTGIDARQYMGNVSARCDIWFTQGMNVFDRVYVNGNAYIAFKAGYIDSTTGTAVGGKFLVPYG